MTLKRKILAIVGSVTLATAANQTAIKNTKNTDFTYNGEEEPDFNKINFSDWDKWCDINSEYTRTDGKGYKNKYFSSREEYNFGICAYPIDDAIVQLASDPGMINDGSNRTHVLALSSSGEVYSWGDNEKGQLGTGDTKEVNKPTKISDLNEIVAISISRYASIALDRYGQVWGWGGKDANGHGGVDELTPKKILGLNDIISIKSTYYGFYALSSIGEIYSWGFANNSYPIIGDGINVETPSPVNISKIEGSIINGIKIKSIAKANVGGRALDYDGNMYVWGSNNSSMLGLGAGDTSTKFLPVKVELEKVSKIYDSSYNSTIVKLDDGRLYGVGLILSTRDFEEITWAKDAKHLIFSGANSGSSTGSTFFIDDQGQLIVSGQNNNCQLGLGDRSDKLIPAESTLTNVIITENSATSSYVLNDNGEVYSFGANGYSALGINITYSEVTHVTSPVKMIRSEAAYIVSVAGEIGANSKDDYKHIYTKKHPTKQEAIAASPLQMTSQNDKSPRYDSSSTITNDNYSISDDYFTNSIGGEMCSEAGDCFIIPEIREPDEDMNGPNYNFDHEDYNGGIPEEYDLALVRPVTFSVTEGEENIINIPLFDRDRTNSKNIKINKLGQINDNLVVLMEVYSTDENGEEVLVTTERFDNKGANKGNFIIEAPNYYEDYKEATFKFRTYLDIDANKENGEIQYYSSTRTFTHAPLPTTTNIEPQAVLLITTTIAVAGVALVGGYLYLKSRKAPSRY